MRYSALNTLGDLWRDVITEMDARRFRSLLMIVAISMSIGALELAVSVSSTASRQVDASLAATTLDAISVRTVTPPESLQDTPDFFPGDAVQRVMALEQVGSAGLRLEVSGNASADVERLGLDAGTFGAVAVTGVTSGYLAANQNASGARHWVLDQPLAIAFLGSSAAQKLQIPITADVTGLNLTLNGTEYAVVGFLDDGAANLSNAIVIPYAQARGIVGSDKEAMMLVHANPGAGATVSPVLRLAIRPDSPEVLTSSQVMDVNSLRSGVSTELDRFAAMTGGILLVLTFLLIANTMVVSVTARAGEIGLRRAMGSSRRYIGGLFLTEGVLCGLLGGLMGSALALVVLPVVCLLNDWTPSPSVPLTLAGPLLGAATGLISALYPAMRATSIEAAQALRSE